MEFNDLLRIKDIDPQDVAVALHKGSSRSARRVLCTMVDEDAKAFNAMQSTHPAIQEATLKTRSIMASFVMTGEGQMTVVGLFANAGAQPFAQADRTTRAVFNRMRQKVDGVDIRSMDERLAELENRLLISLSKMDALADLSGRLIVRDPGARNFMRVAERTSLPVIEVARVGRISPPVPDWDELVLTAEELRDLPQDWCVQLAAWRGVYLIVDRVDGARYVGAAYARKTSGGAGRSMWRVTRVSPKSYRGETRRDFSFPFWNCFHRLPRRTRSFIPSGNGCGVLARSNLG